MTEVKHDIEVLDNDLPLKAEITLPTQPESITKAVGELDISTFIREPPPLVFQKRRSGHCIILYLPGILEPIQLWNQKLITLGRNDKYLNLYPTVDLSNHHAVLLGVSRIHAEISYEDSGYFVRDLSSRNGTWVNKTKLILENKVQLANHDTLRLGHLMIQVSSYQDVVKP